MTVYLGTTRIKKFWPKSEPITLLGKWCLSASDDWNDTDYEILPYPFDDKERFKQACNYTTYVYEYFLTQLAKSLNEVHQVDNSIRYWRIIIGPWLRNYIDVIYDRYVCLEEARKRGSGIITLGLDKDSRIVPYDYIDFQTLIETDKYNLQIYSLIMELIGIPLNFKSLNIRKKNCYSGNYSEKFYHVIINNFFSLLPKKGRFRHNVNLSYKDRFILLVLSGFKLGPFNDFSFRLHYSKKIDDKMRALLRSCLGSRDDFEAVIVSLLPTIIPRAYVEFYKEIKNIANKKVKSNLVVLSDNSWNFDEVFKVFAAETIKEEGRLLALQHGVSYGMLRIHPLEKHELLISDKFYSWGWEKGLEKESLISPLPHSKLQAAQNLIPRRIKNREKEDIVFITTMHPRYLYRFHSLPVGPQCLIYLDWGLRFMNALNVRTRRQLILRLYPHKFGWGLQDRWLEAFPKVRFDSQSTQFRDHLVTSKMVVIDHIGTVMLEALAADVPFISYWDSTNHLIRPSSKPYFDQLRQVGIHHDTPESAAAKVNEIHEDPASWWKQREIVAAKNRFSHQFARTSGDWLKVWKEELLSQI